MHTSATLEVDVTGATPNHREGGRTISRIYNLTGGQNGEILLNKAGFVKTW